MTYTCASRIENTCAHTFAGGAGRSGKSVIGTFSLGADSYIIYTCAHITQNTRPHTCAGRAGRSGKSVIGTASLGAESHGHGHVC